MPITMPLSELARRLKPRQPLIGLDVGARYVGVAYTDNSRIISSPHKTFQLMRGNEAHDREESVPGMWHY